jgi:dihydroorotate dehydrogenase (fumarate)
MDLRTKYMGFDLKNPLIHSASPLTYSVDNIRRLEEAGAAAVVMFSIFEEQLRQEEAFMEGALNAGPTARPRRAPTSPMPATTWSSRSATWS